MSEQPKEPEGQVAEATRPDEEERPNLRELSKDALEAILKEHKKWLESEGKEGKRADLRGANLQEVDLFEANLQEADLSKVNLQKADLRRANLQKANLFEANLQGVDLVEANLQEADFRIANLKDANLTHVKGLETALLTDINLEGATGLLGTEFGGKDVTGAKLPEAIAKFEGLVHIEQIAKIARPVFLTMLLGCLYAFATIASTTDTALVTNAPSQILPNLQTAIPTAGFYFAAPILLLSLYLYLHLYLQGLWKGLANLPAIFPDGRTLDETAYPWLLAGLVRAHVPLLKKNRPAFSWLKVALSFITAWVLVPSALVMFWLRYLPNHEWVGTSLHIGLAVASILAATVFYSSAARTLRGDERQPFHWRKCWRDRRSYQTVGIVFAGIVFSVLSYGAIEGARTLDLKFTDVGTWVPRAFERFGYSTFANLRQADVSAKPANWSGKTEDIGLIKGAALQGKDLRYADGVEAFLVRADFRGADLHKFNLETADLRGADLRDTNILKVSHLRLANLQQADLRNANLREADLMGANLQDAKLGFADLQGADLSSAMLQGANLSEANLQGADLERAKLQRAIFHGANLQEANLEGAKLQDADLQGADLKVAKLEGADLRGAKLGSAMLQGANLSEANLQGADLSSAMLQGADLERAYLFEANLEGANLSLTNFEGATGLTAKFVENACYQPKIGDQRVDRFRGPPINLPDNITIPPCK